MCSCFCFIKLYIICQRVLDFIFLSISCSPAFYISQLINFIRRIDTFLRDYGAGEMRETVLKRAIKIMVKFSDAEKHILNGKRKLRPVICLLGCSLIVLKKANRNKQLDFWFLLSFCCL